MGAAARTELIAPGTLLGKYRVIHRIAFGGMAEIYLARASGIQGFEKYVVLKRILPQFAENHELIRMFLQEARLAAILDHANIAQVHDIGEESGIYFFTMEYLHGEDARRIMKALAERDAAMPLAHAIHVVIDAASGVHFAHEKKGSDGRSLGIVHRDLSPSNIVVTYAGEVKVVDFGVAKIAADPELSGRYSLKGKLAYMSPEQISQGSVDRRSDVFALGIVLYELTTRKRLFKGTNEIETMQLVLDTRIPRPSEVVPDYPPDLERIVMRALEHSPDRRYQSARELQVELEAFARDQKLQISSAGLAEWMEATFGAKREIWHLLPALSAESESAPRPNEPTAATRKVSHAELHDPQGTTGSQRSRPSRRRTPIVAAAVTLLVLLVGGGAFALRQRAALEPAAPSAPGSGAVFVVAESGNVAIEQPKGPAPAPAPAAPADAPAAAPPPPVGGLHVEAEVPPAETGSSRSRRAARGHRAGGSDGLSSALAKQAGEIRRCFAGVGGDDARLSEISLRFEVGTDGAVKSVGVLPPAVSGTPLGACLAKVGQATVFPRQSEPIAFRIPLTLQLRHRERGR
jgi:serine/threonine protein kinase